MKSLAQEWIDKYIGSRRDECMIWPFFKDTNGRARMGLGSGKVLHVARIMCEAMHGPAPSDKHRAVVTCERRKEGCCAPAHTAWRSPGEMTKAAWNSGTMRAVGTRASFTEMEIDRFRYLREQGNTYDEIATETGENRSSIYYWLYGRKSRGHDQSPVTKRRLAGVMTHVEMRRLGIPIPRANQWRAPKTPTLDHYRLMARVNRMVPEGIVYRDDLKSEIIADCLAGEISFDQITPALVRRYKTRLLGSNFEQHGYSLSLDMPMANGGSWHDILSA